MCHAAAPAPQLMLPATRRLLNSFYRPFNHELRALLKNEDHDDDAFLWGYGAYPGRLSERMVRDAYVGVTVGF